MDELKERLEKILSYVKSEGIRYGREITVVGATKTRSAEEINRAVSYGLKAVGENKPQELRDKLPFLSKEAELHFIGHLQENKIKYVAGKVKLIHSCDSLPLAYAIDGYCAKNGITQDLLIEYKVSKEETKHGFDEYGLGNLYERLEKLKNVRFKGLMVVLPKLDDKENLKKYCLKARKVFEDQKTVFGNDFEIFSMGMSEDYKYALEYGSNTLRLGRAIFGDRH